MIGNTMAALVPARTKAFRSVQVRCNLLKAQTPDGYSPLQINTHSSWLRDAQGLVPTSSWTPVKGSPEPYLDNGGSLCVTYNFKSTTPLPLGAKLDLPTSQEQRYANHGIVMYAHIIPQAPKYNATPVVTTFDEACELPLCPQTPPMCAPAAPRDDLRAPQSTQTIVPSQNMPKRVPQSDCDATPTNEEPPSGSLEPSSIDTEGSHPLTHAHDISPPSVN